MVRGPARWLTGPMVTNTWRAGVAVGYAALFAVAALTARPGWLVTGLAVAATACWASAREPGQSLQRKNRRASNVAPTAQTVITSQATGSARPSASAARRLSPSAADGSRETTAA